MKSIPQSNYRHCIVAACLVAGFLFLSFSTMAICITPPSGLVGWWRGEGNAFDQAGTNNGTLVGNAAYVAGRVNQAFAFDGSADGVSLGNPPELQLQNFTIEAWIKRDDANRVSLEPWDSGLIFCYAWGGYTLALHDNGRPFLSKVGYSSVDSTLAVTDTNNFHHVAVTKSGANVVFYVDGISQVAAPYDPGFVFNGPVAIGSRGGDFVAAFLGSIDEVSVYNRALTAGEMQSIYNAGSSGKCLIGTPPSINSHPPSQTAIVGDNVAFSVSSSGTSPLSYQWRLNGTNIVNATNVNLNLANVQLTQAGNYSVVVSNIAGSAFSSNAVLSVNTSAICVTQPSGLVGWWRGEGNAFDQAGTNNGTLVGNISYAAGRVNQAFVFDGSGDGFSVGNPASLQLQDFTIEAWVKRSDANRVSLEPWDSGLIFCHTWGGYTLALHDNGRPFLSKVGYSSVDSTLAITDTNNFHHVAVTKSGTNVVFYVDGNAETVASYDPGFVFTGPAAIGARGSDYVAGFLGLIDEVSVYNRALSAGEIQSVYGAANSGKCVTGLPPTIVSQPLNQTVVNGANATFVAVVSGTLPISFQWRHNSSNIANATNSALSLTNVQLGQAGNYSVVVSNIAGTAVSSNAVLTVNAVSSCITPQSGLVGWWRGEGNSFDQAGTNNGVLLGNSAYHAGRVGQAIGFDGSGDSMSLGSAPSLQLQTFTFEAWVKRGSASIISHDPYQSGIILSYPEGGYGFALWSDGRVFLTQNGSSAVFSTQTITDTNYHHIAVTKTGGTVMIYVDGVGENVGPYNPTFVFNGPVAIGARGGDLVASFLGDIDEVSVYNRALTLGEVQSIYNAGSSGKCVVSIPPSIISHPANKTVQVGANATFNVAVGGSQPFSYQWRFNGTNIVNATNSTLSLTNVQFNQAGNYSVVVSNEASSVLSSNAVLTVTYPPANLRVGSTNIVSGRLVTLPIVVTANGNENAVSFSLNYTTTRLRFNSAELGSFPSGTYFYINTSQTNLGRLGVTAALPTGTTFAPGTQTLAGVTFDVLISLSYSPTTTTVSFGDAPLPRGLTDVNAATLAATYTSGSVTILGTDLEADTIPRPGGNRSLTINDWVQAGRFAAKLDVPAVGGEYQRADSAPRSSHGNGKITVSDWVQAGRFFAGVDPIAAVGGPSSDTTGPNMAALSAAQQNQPLNIAGVREVLVAATNAIQDLIVTVPVSLQSLGDENGLGFTLSYDPAALNYSMASLGSGATGASFNINTNQIASGKLGVAMVLPTGSSFATGLREIAKINFIPKAAGNHPVTLSDQLVTREVSDSAALELFANYVAGSVAVNPLPSLAIVRTGSDAIISWPAWASGFNLQSSTNGASSSWIDVANAPQTSGDNLTVTLGLSGETKFFRLRHP